MKLCKQRNDVTPNILKIPRLAPNDSVTYRKALSNFKGTRVIATGLILET